MVEKRYLGRLHVGHWLGVLVGALVVTGLALISAYAIATDGPHVRYLGVGLLTALASLATGCLIGFLFGIPRIVSSGQLRFESAAARPVTRTKNAATGSMQSTATHDGAAEDPNDEDQGSALNRFTPSTNLSEVSDWLTKLLLGAGLVQLTNLGRPLGTLIDAVAGGLEEISGGEGPTGSAQVIAGAILVMYLVLGFLASYVVTTLWYGRRIGEV